MDTSTQHGRLAFFPTSFGGNGLVGFTMRGKKPSMYFSLIWGLPLGWLA